MENVYQIVTNRIVELLDKGIIPWRKPWKGALADAEDCAISYVTRRAYSMLNQWLLGEPGEYLTFKQIHDLGGKVVKGAKARMVVFYTKASYVKTDAETGEETLVSYPLLKYYNVFHINETTGIASKCKPGEKVEVEQGDEAADAMISDYVSRTRLHFRNDKPSNEAFYRPGSDTVVVPMKSQYDNIAEYYSTTFHELTHSTMRKDRCDRDAEKRLHHFVEWNKCCPKILPQSFKK